MTDGPPTIAATGARARQREERRQRLIAAARTLLAEGGASGFSMATLAQRANLSLATPYNLFGSKAAILHAVVAAEFAGLYRAVGTADPRDPARLTLEVAGRIGQVVARKPAFYRGLSHSLSVLGPEELRGLMVPLGETMLTPLAQAMAAAGMIRAALPAEVLGVQFAFAVEAVFLHWAALDWSGPRLTAELSLSMGLTLLGALTEPPRPAFAAALDTVTAQLIAMRAA
ncbi:TetR/AcrR family transcriptional regulator [Sphingomonas bacterium]|uniref:TetR/AcrR family transcriptional regulator n=1 Tax=Sphingomonas bacterium TaxID=1895847 RepID=UPI001576A202|nr:helix-turn-helix domain-containing protein [Sphingomonas bacterium]